MRTFLLAALVSIAAAGSVQAGEVPKPAEARIPFVNLGGVQDWRDDGRDAIYVQDIHRQWYRGTFMGPCIDLPYANAVGFETRGLDTLDRFGTVIVRGHRCQLSSFVKSAPPPKKADRKKHGIEKVQPVGTPAA